MIELVFFYANPFRYSSYQYDKVDLGKELYYLKTRYYDAKLGRFLTRDAVTSINMYAYVGNDPVMNVDPSGLWFETLLDVASLAQSGYEMYKNPSLTNGLFLAWDVVSLLPLVPGSYVAKGLKYLGNVDEVADASRVVNKGMSRTEYARRMGKLSEEAAGITKNTRRIESITGKAKYRIPDGLDELNQVLTEVKNVKRQGYTSQIKDFLLWSKANGYEFIIKTRPDTKISRPLQELIDCGEIIHQLIDLN